MEELKEGTDFYYSEEEYLVFTEHYHLKKGYCCGNGCRHCPYRFENVPEPRRSQLLHEKAEQPKNPVAAKR
jgi:hypothetical protein